MRYEVAADGQREGEEDRGSDLWSMDLYFALCARRDTEERKKERKRNSNPSALDLVGCVLRRDLRFE